MQWNRRALKFEVVNLPSKGKASSPCTNDTEMLTIADDTLTLGDIKSITKGVQKLKSRDGDNDGVQPAVDPFSEEEDIAPPSTPPQPPALTSKPPPSSASSPPIAPPPILPPLSQSGPAPYSGPASNIRKRKGHNVITSDSDGDGTYQPPKKGSENKKAKTADGTESTEASKKETPATEQEAPTSAKADNDNGPPDTEMTGSGNDKTSHTPKAPPRTLDWQQLDAQAIAEAAGGQGTNATAM